MWSSLVIPTFLFLTFFSVGLAPDPGSTINPNDNYLPFGDQINGDSRISVQNNKIIIDPCKYMDSLRIMRSLKQNQTNTLLHLEQTIQGMYIG